MAIEAALMALTTAVEANTAALTKMMGAAKSGAAAAPAAGAAATKPAPAAAKAKDVSDDDLRKVFGDYMAAATDDNDRAERRGTVVKVLEHFGATKGATTIPKESRAAAVAAIKTLSGGGTPDFLAVEEDAAGGDGDDLLG